MITRTPRRHPPRSAAGPAPPPRPRRRPGGGRRRTRRSPPARARRRPPRATPPDGPSPCAAPRASRSVFVACSSSCSRLVARRAARRSPAPGAGPLPPARGRPARPRRHARGGARQHLRPERQRPRGVGRTVEHLGRPAPDRESRALRGASWHPSSVSTRRRSHSGSGRSTRRSCTSRARSRKASADAVRGPEARRARLRARAEAVLPVRPARGPPARVRRHGQQRARGLEAGPTRTLGGTPGRHEVEQ